MGEIQKQGTTNAISNYLGIALGAVNTMILYPTVFEGREDEWGLIRLLLSVSLVVSVFSNLGVARGLTRFIPYYPEERKGLIAFAWRVSLLGFIILVSVSVLFKDHILDFLDNGPLFNAYSSFALPLITVLMFTELLGGVFGGFVRTRLPQFLTDVGVRLGVMALLLYCYIWPISIDVFLYLFIGVYLIRFLILLAVMVRDYGIPVRMTLSSKTRKAIISYGSIALFSGSSSILLVNIDQLMIGRYLPLDQLAIYGMAFFMASVVQAPAKAVNVVGTAMLSKAWANNNTKNIQVIYEKSALNQLVVAGIVYGMLLFNLNLLFSLLPNTEFYQNGIEIFVVVGLARVIGSAMGLNGLVLMTSSKFRVNLIFNVIMVALTIFLNTLLIPIYGLMGAAWALLLSLLIDNLLRITYLYFKFGIQPFNRRTLVALGLIGIPFLVIYFIPSLQNIWVNSALKTIAYGIICAFLIYRTAISAELKNILQTVLSKAGIRP